MERGDDSSFARLNWQDSRNSRRGVIGRALRILANRIESGQRAIRKQYGPSSVAELFGWVVVKFDKGGRIVRQIPFFHYIIADFRF
jgi:hypothetical protein